MTPWSTDVSVEGEQIVVTAMLSTDRGPVRAFTPFLDVRLDEAHATELLGHLVRALEQLRGRRDESDTGSGLILAFPGAPA